MKNTKRRVVIVLIVLLVASILCSMLVACNQDTGGDDAPKDSYSSNDETAMAVARIKGASYTADIAALVGEDNAAEPAASPVANAVYSRPLPTIIKNSEVVESYNDANLTETSTYWLSLIKTYQDDADTWGATAKTKILSFIDKAVVFDKWIQSTNLPPNDPNYLSFMVHYDAVNDVVTLYSNYGSLEAYRYYFDEDGNEVLEAYSYALNVANTGYSPATYTKYVKGKSYTIMRTNRNGSFYFDIHNINGNLNWLSYSDDAISGHKVIDVLVNDGAKAVFYSSDSSGLYRTMEYIYEGNMLFRVTDTQTTDNSMAGNLHPVSLVEYSLNALDGFEYVATTGSASGSTRWTYLLTEYIGYEAYTDSADPLKTYYPANTSEDGGYFYDEVLDFEPVESHFYIDIDQINSTSHLSDVQRTNESGTVTIDKAYIQRLMAKLCETNNPNRYEFKQYYPEYFGLGKYAYNGWTIFEAKDLVPFLVDDDMIKYFPDLDPTDRPDNTNAYVTYYNSAPHMWGQKGGCLEMYDFSGIDICSNTTPLYINSAYQQQYYDFRSCYNAYDATIADISILGTKNAFTSASGTAIKNAIVEKSKESFLDAFDIKTLETISPDQLETSTAAMFAPVVSSGCGVSAATSADGKDVVLTIAEGVITVTANVLLQNGSEYRSELGYVNGNNTLSAAMTGAAVSYAGGDLSLPFGGTAVVSGNLKFDENYIVCAFVSKKIGEKWVKVSGAVPLVTSQSGAGTYIVDTFGKKTGNGYTVGFGAKRVNDNLAIVQQGEDTVAPTVTFGDYAVTTDAAFNGAGLILDGKKVIIPAAEVPNLGALRNMITVTDNVDGKLTVGLNNFAAYKMIGESEDEWTLVPDTEAVAYTAYSQTAMARITILTISDAAGNSVQIAIVIQP